MLYGFGKIGYGLVGVAVFDAFFNAMAEVAFQNNLSGFMDGLFDGVYLNKNVLAGDILVNHLVYCLNLSQYPV
jgi:hypothetical protein